MNYKFIISFCLTFLYTMTCNTLSAQRQKLIDGSLRGLKPEKSFDVRFVYSDTSKTFLQDSITRKFESAFVGGFREFTHVSLGDKAARYTFIITTKHIESGAESESLIAHPGAVTGEAWIVESKNPTNIVAKIEFYDFGRVIPSNDPTGTGRVQSAYEWAGKGIGNFFARKVK